MAVIRARAAAAFVRLLNETAWVPGRDGALHYPGEVTFDSLGWKPDPFLQSKILFKPPIVEQLAKEAGIDPAVLDLLKRQGVTNLEEFSRRFGVDGGAQTDPAADDALNGNVEAVEDEHEVKHPQQMPEGETGGNSDDGDGSSEEKLGGHRHQSRGGGEGGGEGRGRVSREGSGSDSKSIAGGVEPSESRPFISYIGSHPIDREAEHDPDGLGRDERMALEAKAIERILRIEPELERTQANNPGFDLFEPGDHGRPIRWVEVKAMTGSLDNRPVCMSRTQFDCAWVNGEAYWLYVVEHAANLDRARILRINDPAGKAKTFTFDRGWQLVADIHICHMDG